MDKLGSDIFSDWSQGQTSKESFSMLTDVCESMLYSICSLNFKTKFALDAADQYLLQFCKLFHTLYGAQHCTVNMHLHLHLILDYGPVYSFWSFPLKG